MESILIYKDNIHKERYLPREKSAGPRKVPHLVPEEKGI